MEGDIIVHDDDYYFRVIRYNVRKYRIKANMTQQELADSAGVTMNYISKIESEKMRRGLSIVVLGRIADGLKIDIRKLFDDIDEK